MKNILVIAMLVLACSCETNANTNKNNGAAATSKDTTGSGSLDTTAYKPDPLLKPGQYPPTGDTSTNGAVNGQNTGIVKDTTKKVKHKK
jgi:hypothetical protein